MFDLKAQPASISFAICGLRRIIIVFLFFQTNKMEMEMEMKQSFFFFAFWPFALRCGAVFYT